MILRVQVSNSGELTRAPEVCWGFWQVVLRNPSRWSVIMGDRRPGNGEPAKLHHWNRATGQGHGAKPQPQWAWLEQDPNSWNVWRTRICQQRT